MSGGLNFGMRLLDTCRRFADRPALVDARESLTYREFAEAAVALGQAPGLGDVRSGEPVLVVVAGRIHDLIGFLAVWRAGGVVVPVHRSSAEFTVRDLVQRTGARYVVDSDRHALPLPTVEGTGPVFRTGLAAPPADPMLDGAAWIVFTSGSTGEPKGVVHSHDVWSAKLDAIGAEIGTVADAPTILVLQPTFIFGQWLSCLALLAGGTLCIRDRFEPQAVLSNLAGGARIGVVPTMLRRLRQIVGTASFPDFEGDILSGGEPMPVDLAAWVRETWPNARLWDLYGSTEMGSCDFFVRPEDWDEATGAIGRPGPGIEVRVDPDTGELLVRSPYAMRGYFRDPERTRAAYRDGYFRTGDAAEIRPDGRVRLVGRLGDMINRGGIKISPLEIERAFMERPDISAALATGVPDPVRGEALHVYVVPRDNAALDPAALLDWARERMDRTKVPDGIVVGTDIPTGRTGKADRAALRARIRSF